MNINKGGVKMLLSELCSPFLTSLSDFNPNHKSALESLILTVCHSPHKYSNIRVDRSIVDVYLLTYDQVIEDRPIGFTRKSQENALGQLIQIAESKAIFPSIEIDQHEKHDIEV